MRIYISGPERYQGAHNEAETMLQRAGHKARNPAKIFSQIELDEKDKEEMRKSLISISDAIFLLTGWQQDPISSLEFDKAIKEGLCIIFEQEGVSYEKNKTGKNKGIFAKIKKRNRTKR